MSGRGGIDMSGRGEGRYEWEGNRVDMSGRERG